jgi:RimJ/RimL family protein N-acetyltransferase
MNFWQGEKVRLRGVEPTDADTFFKWNQDTEAARRLEFLWPPVPHAEVAEWLRQQSVKKLDNDAFIWLIETVDSKPIGSIRTHNCDHRNGTFSYGVFIAGEHQRRGYAVDAVRIILRYYFEELRYEKAIAQVYAFNTDSIALHEKLGFKLEGTHRSMVFSSGQRHDALWYGMTREEWEELNTPTLDLPG